MSGTCVHSFFLSFTMDREKNHGRLVTPSTAGGPSTLHTDSSQFLKLSLVVETAFGGRGSRAGIQHEEDISTSISYLNLVFFGVSIVHGLSLSPDFFVLVIWLLGVAQHVCEPISLSSLSVSPQTKGGGRKSYWVRRVAKCVSGPLTRREAAFWHKFITNFRSNRCRIGENEHSRSWWTAFPCVTMLSLFPLYLPH